MVPISSGSDLVYLFTNTLSPVDEERSTFPSSFIWSTYLRTNICLNTTQGRNMLPFSSQKSTLSPFTPYSYLIRFFVWWSRPVVHGATLKLFRHGLRLYEYIFACRRRVVYFSFEFNQVYLFTNQYLPQYDTGSTLPTIRNMLPFSSQKSTLSAFHSTHI